MEFTYSFTEWGEISSIAAARWRAALTEILLGEGACAWPWPPTMSLWSRDSLCRLLGDGKAGSGRRLRIGHVASVGVHVAHIAVTVPPSCLRPCRREGGRQVVLLLKPADERPCVRVVQQTAGTLLP